MARVELSIAICTHNRSADLDECLVALTPQLVGYDVELLVVDSGSCAAERSALVAVVAKYPQARLTRLEQAGLSRARNTAIAASSAPWVAFIDDDAIPEPDWLEHALRLTRAASESCAVIGGDVQAILPRGHQPRFGARWAQLLSLVRQTGERDTTVSAAICGANVIFRRAALAEVGEFPLNLGRQGTRLISGEEKLIQERLVARGWRVLSSDRLRVGHKIPVERLKIRWVVRRAYWDGVSDERIATMSRRATSDLQMLGIALRTPALAALSPFSRGRHEFFIRFAYNIGRISEFRAGSDVPSNVSDVA
jgi:glycosyltransferase involved in cell wall biosynthesis